MRTNIDIVAPPTGTLLQVYNYVTALFTLPISNALLDHKFPCSFWQNHYQEIAATLVAQNHFSIIVLHRVSGYESGIGCTYHCNSLVHQCCMKFTISMGRTNSVHHLLSFLLLPQNGWTALISASYYNHPEVVEKLLAAGAQPNHQAFVSM